MTRTKCLALSALREADGFVSSYIQASTSLTASSNYVSHVCRSMRSLPSPSSNVMGSSSFARPCAVMQPCRGFAASRQTTPLDGPATTEKEDLIEEYRPIDSHMEELKALGKYALMSLTLAVGTLAVHYESLLDLALSILPLQKVHLSSAGVGTSIMLCLMAGLAVCWPVFLLQAVGFLLPGMLPVERAWTLSILACHAALSILAVQLLPAVLGISAEALDPHMPQLLEFDASGGFEAVLGAPVAPGGPSSDPQPPGTGRMPQVHLDPSLDSTLTQIIRTVLGTLLAVHMPLFTAPWLSRRIADGASRLRLRQNGLLLAFVLAAPWAGLSMERGALAFLAGWGVLEASFLAAYYWRRTRGLLVVPRF